MEITAFTIPVMPRPKGSGKVIVSARVSPAWVEALKAMADEQERRVTYFVEKAIGEYLEKHGAKNTTGKRKRS